MATADKKPDEAKMLFIHEHKTADLFRAAIEMGALSGGADEHTLQALSRYGRATGLTFQLVDDLLDADDPDDHSFSCVNIIGRDAARTRAAALTTEAITALLPFGSEADALRALATRLLERTT
jgi:geranylgeranyl pyrophosphate synthase